MKMVSLDFETTGVVQGYPNEPWQLGLVAIEEGRALPETKREFFFHIDRERPFSRRAPGRWAMLREELNAAPTLEEQWADIAPFITGVPLIAHNAATERTILTKHAPLSRLGPWMDTLQLARKVYPNAPSHALGDLLAYLGLTAAVEELCPHRTWHDALYDACAGAILFSHFIPHS